MAKRKVRFFLTILVLIISLALLTWGLWPFPEITQTLIFPAGSLVVP